MKEGIKLNNRTLDCVCFEDYYDLIDDTLEVIDSSEDYCFASIVGKYEEIRQILSLLISDYDVLIGDIELCSRDSNGYEDEYIMTVYNDEDDVVVSCERLKGSEGYFNYGADMVYILGNCNSAVQHYCETGDVYFVIFDNEDFDCDEECCKCSEDERHIGYSTTNNGDTHGFTASKSDDNGYYSFSYFSTDILSENDIHTMLKKFGF